MQIEKQNADWKTIKVLRRGVTVTYYGSLPGLAAYREIFIFRRSF